MTRAASFNKPLTETQRAALGALAAWRAATIDQLAQLVDITPRGLRMALAPLAELGAIALHNIEAASPTIVELRHAGARLAGITLPSNRVLLSWATLTHQCRRNELELRLRAKFPGRFLTRIELFRLGLNPSVAEHGYRLDDGRLWCVILDDYGMTAGSRGRVSRSWSRAHTPRPAYYPDPSSTRWNERADGLVIATLSRDQAERHRRYMPPLLAGTSTTAAHTEPGATITPLYVTVPALWS